MPEEHAPFQGIKNFPCQGLLPPTHLYLFYFFLSYPSLFLPRLCPLNNPVPVPPSPSALWNSPLREFFIFFSLHPPITYWFAMSHTSILAFYTFVIFFQAEITLLF